MKSHRNKVKALPDIDREEYAMYRYYRSPWGQVRDRNLAEDAGPNSGRIAPEAITLWEPTAWKKAQGLLIWKTHP